MPEEPDRSERRTREGLEPCKLFKTARISGQISPALIARAKRNTGIGLDTELVEYALATLALDDGFAEAFARARGTIDPDLLLGY